MTDASDRDWLNSSPKKIHGGLARQRADLRRSVSCNFIVRTGPGFVIARNVHDLSLNGAFVEMDQENLSRGDRVEIVISFVYNQRPVEHQISAEVVRLDPRGVGFRFEPYSDLVYTDLVNLIHTE